MLNGIVTQLGFDVVETPFPITGNIHVSDQAVQVKETISSIKLVPATVVARPEWIVQAIANCQSPGFLYAANSGRSEVNRLV